MDDTHDVEIMRRTLDITSLDRLNGIKKLRKRSDHPQLSLHEGEDEAEVKTDFYRHYSVCYDRF